MPSRTITVHKPYLSNSPCCRYFQPDIAPCNRLCQATEGSFGVAALKVCRFLGEPFPHSSHFGPERLY
jgi:hypothetical protein